MAVYMTNQVASKKHAGGHVLGHATTIRLMFTNGKGEQWVARCSKPQTYLKLKLYPFCLDLRLAIRFIKIFQITLQTLNEISRNLISIGEKVDTVSIYG